MMFENKSADVKDTCTISMGRIEDWTITSLRYTCKKNKVPGYTKRSKDQLVEAVKGIFAKLVD